MQKVVKPQVWDPSSCDVQTPVTGTLDIAWYDTERFCSKQVNTSCTNTVLDPNDSFSPQILDLGDGTPTILAGFKPRRW